MSTVTICTENKFSGGELVVRLPVDCNGFEVDTDSISTRRKHQRLTSFEREAALDVMDSIKEHLISKMGFNGSIKPKLIRGHASKTAPLLTTMASCTITDDFNNSDDVMIVAVSKLH